MKNRTAAGLFALLLGGLGVHKFYLGQIGMGILYLLFCWTFIPAIVGLVEGILYLTMSDADFNARYNPGLVPAASTSDLVRELRDLDELRQSGILSEEEFQAKKRKLVDRI